MNTVYVIDVSAPLLGVTMHRYYNIRASSAPEAIELALERARRDGYAPIDAKLHTYGDTHEGVTARHRRKKAKNANH